MNFKKINESFEKIYQPIDESLNYTEDCIKRLTEALNEAEISDEDKHDSDLIRSMLDKMQGRSNAKFSPEEIAIMDKYGIKRDNNTRKLSVDGRELNRDIDGRGASRWYGQKGTSNGTPSKINYADRARKLPKRKDSQIFTGPWTVDNDQLNTHGYNQTRLNGLQDAERYAQDIPMRDKISKMQYALRDRKYYQNQIDNADTERKQALDKAQKNYDAAVSNAERDYTRHTVDASKSRDRYQAEIDNLLKKDKKEEALKESAGGKWTEKAFVIVNNLDNTTELKDMLKKLLKDMSDKDVGEFLHQRGYVEYKD